LEYLKERNHLKDLGMDGILKMGLKSRLGWHGLDSSGSGYEQVAGACEHGNNRAYKMWGIFREDILLCFIN